MRDGDYLYLKYNATLDKSIGLTVEDMSLLEDNYIPNYMAGEPDVPIAEISLLGINVNEDSFSYSTLNELYHNRTELVAWKTSLDPTPFEDPFYDTYREMIFNISFEDIKNDFITQDEAGVEYSYITDILITSNDPSYELVVDSFFIFEFDYNSTLYDSEIFDLYPYNHMEQYYFNYNNIYDTSIILNSSEYLPIYYFNSSINETIYFEAYDSRDNYYYFGEHLDAVNISQGVYNITWNPWYSEEFYYGAKYANSTEELMDLYGYYNPYISNYSYLYISYADEDAWKEWRTIEQTNIIKDSIQVAYDQFDETTEEFTSVYYNQSLGEFDVRQIATEYIYPYNVTENSYEFTLSQNYSQAIDLGILSVEGYYFNETSLTLSGQILSDGETINITVPAGKVLSEFQFIVVLLNFSEGANSDLTQIRLTDSALSNHPESQYWSVNDSLWVDYEFNDLDYFLLFEDYIFTNILKIPFFNNRIIIICCVALINAKFISTKNTLTLEDWMP